MIVSRTKDIIGEYNPQERVFEKEPFLTVWLDTYMVKECKPLKAHRVFKLFLDKPNSKFIEDIDIALKIGHKFLYKPVYKPKDDTVEIKFKTSKELDLTNYKFFLICVKVSKKLKICYELLEYSSYIREVQTL